MITVAIMDHLQTHNHTLSSYFTEFDNDYDGYLSPREFYDSL